MQAHPVKKETRRSRESTEHLMQVHWIEKETRRSREPTSAGRAAIAGKSFAQDGRIVSWHWKWVLIKNPSSDSDYNLFFIPVELREWRHIKLIVVQVFLETFSFISSHKLEDHLTLVTQDCHVFPLDWGCFMIHKTAKPWKVGLSVEQH